jgi:2-polyprenyl-3-methyl-5-hydroxy-6-metoxy-1,4-benzoquinol methylase
MKMLHRLYDHQQSDSLAATLRSKRLNLLLSLLSTLPTPIKVLDVGGRVAFWQSTGLLDTEFAQVSITLLNTSVEEIGREHPQMKYVVGDARDMSQFRPKEFDFVFSNSVIEHVGSYADQSRMAKEIERVGKRYFVQTPNFYFPIEPHFVFPAFHWLPITIRVWLITHFNLGWYSKFSDVQSASAEVRSIRLLKKREFVRLFPDSKLFEERFFGLTKSFVLYSK